MGDGWAIKPCTECGTEIEDEDNGLDWICTGCWPDVERKRLRAEVTSLKSRAALLEAVVEAAEAVPRTRWEYGLRSFETVNAVSVLEAALRKLDGKTGEPK